MQPVRKVRTTACASSLRRRKCFAGHPTLGTCHAWLASGGQPQSTERIVQECARLITIERSPDGLAFASPESRAVPLPHNLHQVYRTLGITTLSK